VQDLTVIFPLEVFMKKLLFVLIAVVVCFSTASSETFFVPDQYATIQAGIDAANNGDVVMIADGVYTGIGNRDIEFQGKEIRVESINGPKFCIINCEGSSSDPHTGFIFNNHEDSNAVLLGLTVHNGYTGNGTVSDGAAIHCFYSNPMCFLLQHC